jgi:hypothetical protein
MDSAFAIVVKLAQYTACFDIYFIRRDRALWSSGRYGLAN